MNKIREYVKPIGIPVIVGGVVGVIISPFMDYSTLQKPFLAPPGIVFLIVWSILYILMGISYGILKTRDLITPKISFLYYFQLVVNALWPIIFFVFKGRLFAFIWIIVLVILVAFMIIEFYRKNKTAGLLQIPYLVWIIFATYLNLAFYILNQ